MDMSSPPSQCPKGHFVPFTAPVSTVGRARIKHAGWHLPYPGIEIPARNGAKSTYVDW